MSTMRRLRESVVTAFALTMSWTLVSATVVSGYQATGHENNQGQGYTGVTMTHQILSNVEGLNCLNQFIWDVEAIYFDVDQGAGLELGTEYSCVSYADYWAYRANGARWEIGRINLPPSGVWRLYRLFRSNPGTGAWSYKIEGNVVYTIAGYYTTGVALTTGLVANQNTAVMSYHRNLGLEKKRWDGAWEAWAGQDGMWVDNPPMCGNWVSATEWREGEKVC